MDSGILGVIGTLLALVLWWLKRRDTPEKKQDRILRALEERIAKTRKADGAGNADDIARHDAELGDDVVRETTDFHGRGDDRGHERPE